MALKRATPPPIAGNTKTTNWREVFDDIRNTPWEWVEAGIYPAAYVTAIKNGRFAGSEPNEFEATMRKTDKETQRGTLYVRYIAVDKPEGFQDVKP